MNTSIIAVQSANSDRIPTIAPSFLAFSAQCQEAVNAIKATMKQVSLTCIAESYGKDSSACLALALEAATQLKAEGLNPKIRIITSDTGVENPAQTKLAYRMSEQALTFSRARGLDVEQIWVTPDPINHYLVTMIGMRGVASMPESSATCSVQLKVEPMDKARRKLAKTYGAENIAVVIGTRFDESANRGSNMKARGENAITPIRQTTGSLQLSPIAHWSEGDVWRLLNGNTKQTGFETLDFTPTILHYELMGDATCNTISPAEQRAAKSPCSGGRGGCFLCQKVSKDHSMDNMLEAKPEYEPLARLSKTIRAGHYIPENRNFIAKTVDDQGQIRVFSNAYSAAWTSKLLKWTMTIDVREDEWVAEQSAKRGRPVARRFPRLLTNEHLLLIAFMWSRYGIQAPGEMARVREAILQGARWDLPTDDELAALQAQGNKKLMGKTIGYLTSDHSEDDKPVFADHWRDQVGAESGCTPNIMRTDTGDRAMYPNSTGLIHDTIEASDLIEANLSHFATSIELEDFLWWYASEFAGGKKGSNDEMNFLIREGVIRARNGYQSTIAEYQKHNRVIQTLREAGPINSLEDIMSHPAFTEQSASKPKALISSDTRPIRKESPDQDIQLALFAA